MMLSSLLADTCFGWCTIEHLPPALLLVRRTECLDFSVLVVNDLTAGSAEKARTGYNSTVLTDGGEYANVCKPIQMSASKSDRVEHDN